MKRIAAFSLAFVMLLGLFACAQSPADVPIDSGKTESDSAEMPADGTNADVSDTEVPVETEAPVDPLADNLPEETFDGEEIVIWLDSPYPYYDFTDEEYREGDVMCEAILTRNDTVEDRFDVELNFNRDLSVWWRDTALLQQSILAGDEYDIIEGSVYFCSPLTIGGCYVNLADNEYINFDKAWWQSYATDSLKIVDRQYMASGFFDFTTLPRTSVIFFNTQMVEDNALGNLYDLVNSGEWTFDKMLELSEKVSMDVDQDGEWTSADIYGVSSRWDFWCGQPETAGYQYTTVRDDGSISLVGMNNRLLTIHEKIYPFITNSSLYWSSYTYGDPGFDGTRNTEMLQMFANSQILFLLGTLDYTEQEIFRNFGDYGLLPSPKYLPDQETYGAATSAFACGIAVTTGSYRCTSIVLEALQAESYKQMRPAYMDVALSYKYLNDPQAVQMLDLIFANVTTSFIYNYGRANIGEELYSAIASEANIASFLTARKSSIDAKLDDFMSAINALPDYIPNN